MNKNNYKNKHLLNWLQFLWVIITVCLVLPAQGNDYGSNLVVDGDAESVLISGSSVTTFPGWVSDGNVSIQQYGASGGFPTISDPGSPTRGNNFFYGGDVDLATASQTIDIAFAAGEIDKGDVKFDLTAWLGGYSTQEDFASVNINFYDATATGLISTVTLDLVTVSDRSSLTGLLQRSKSGIIPKDARSIVVEMILTRKEGTNNDGYVDDISLILNKANSTPSVSGCTSIYEQNGSLHVPCVSVPDAFGGRVKYDADLQFVPFSSPFRFALKDATQTSFNPDACVAVYELDGKLHLPCVSVPDAFGGRVMYDAHLHLVPGSNPFLFELDDATLIPNFTSPVQIIGGLPGIGTDTPNILLVALPIQNFGMTTAEKVKVTSIKLDSAPLIGSVNPESLGDLAEEALATINAKFDRSSLTPGSEYPLSVTGNYETRGTTHSFTVTSTIIAPSNASRGEFIAKVSTSKSIFISNPKYYPVPSDLKDEEEEGRNPEGAPVPVGKEQILFPAAFSTKLMSELLAGVNPGAGVPTVSFGKDTPFGRNGGTPVDPSGASGVGANAANIVLTTGNTYASVSIDGGQTFTNLNPFCMFGFISCDAAGNQTGSPLVDGNLCCDQVIQYAPTINRFIWLMQTWPTNWVNGGNRSNPSGNNRLRIVVVSPDDVRSWATGGASSWLVFDLTTAGLGLTGANDWLDYPDLSIGNNSLYVSVDRLGSGSGLLVARIPLNQLQAGTINYQYTNPSDINGRAHGSHLMQNPGDAIFWAGHNSTNKLTIFNWPENSNNFAWRDVEINSYSNTDYSSNTPTGTNWLMGSGGFGLENIQAAVRVPLRGLCNPDIGTCPPADELWFAWGAGKNNAKNRPQPYVEVVHIDSQNYSLKQQMHIWNAGFAFAYPAFARNARSEVSEVGVAIGVGGGDREAHTSVGFMGDFLVWSLSNSDSSITRYGDYLTIRKASPNDKLFSAVGYGIRTGVGFDPHYVLFGRFCDVNPNDAACAPPIIR